MADSRGFKSIDHQWSGVVPLDPEYEEVTGVPPSLDPTKPTTESLERARKKRKVVQEEAAAVAAAVAAAAVSGRTPSVRSREESRVRRQTEEKITTTEHHPHEPFGYRVEEQYAVRGFYGDSVPGGPYEASAFKLTRGHNTGRYPQSTAEHHHHYYYPGSVRRSGSRPAPRHYYYPRGVFSNETQEEIQEDDEATLRELLIRYVGSSSSLDSEASSSLYTHDDA